MATKKKAGVKNAGQIGTNSPELDAYIKKGKDSVNAWLSSYTLLLIGADVVRVRVDYSGGGDSGQIDNISFYNEKDSEVERPFGSDLILKRFESFLYDVLDVRGWEVNNEGSQGHMEWDLRADEFTHEHGENFTEVKTTEFDTVEDLMGRVDPDDPRN